ncbi:MAG: hypothetical protein JXA83_15540 [Acidimicrobiales bacterium]|nr:hypothetical protein [Acidimicrobiales bacterium]
MSDPAPGPALLERSTRVVLRPVGNPLPLGFLALAGGTLVVSGLQLGWVDAAEGGNVAVVLIAFVFPLQLLASILGYLARDVVAGTGMGILAGAWLAVGLVLFRSRPGATSDALGLLLLLAAAAICVPATGALLGKLVPAAVMFTTAARYAVTGVYELTGSAGWEDGAGYLGLVLCAVAFYAAVAMLLEDVRRRTVLPVLRRGAGQVSMTGNLADQLQRLEAEAGVREQL